MKKVAVFVALSVFTSCLFAVQPSAENIRHYFDTSKNAWVFALAYDLDKDDSYIDYKQELSAAFDDRSDEDVRGWISIVDDSGDEWVQDQIATTNSTGIVAITDQTQWENLRSGDVAIGTELEISRFWVSRLYDDAVVPQEVYMGIFAGPDIVMGQVVEINLFDDKRSNLSLSGDSPPLVAIETVDGKALSGTDGEGFESGDFVSSLPNFEASASDSEENIVSWSMVVNKENQEIVTASESISPASSADISYEFLSPLESGLYTLQLLVENEDGDVGDDSVQFEVESSIKIKGLISGPLPINFDEHELTIEYQLSSAADVDLRIYDIAGELQKRFQLSAGEQGGLSGFNRLTWNGVNEHNEALRNGPYVIYMQAKNEHGSDTEKSKLVVLR